jgi:hypothetical protein
VHRFGQPFHLARDLGVLREHVRVLLGELLVLVEHPRLALLEALHALGLHLTVLRQLLVVNVVAVGLPGLGQQDQRRGVGGLQREQQVERDERVPVPGDRVRQRQRVQGDPEGDDERLPDDEPRRAEEARESLGENAEAVTAERR